MAGSNKPFVSLGRGVGGLDPARRAFRQSSFARIGAVRLAQFLVMKLVLRRTENKVALARLKVMSSQGEMERYLSDSCHC